MPKLGSTDERVDARNQLRKIKRLGEVIVGARLEPAYTRLELVLCREHEHRREDPAPAKLLQDAEAVASGQHDVEDDALLGAVETAVQGAVTGLGLGNSVALLTKGLYEEPPQIAIVFDEE
jgi:hypothetical protein